MALRQDSLLYLIWSTHWMITFKTPKSREVEYQTIQAWAIALRLNTIAYAGVHSFCQFNLWFGHPMVPVKTIHCRSGDIFLCLACGRLHLAVTYLLVSFVIFHEWIHPCVLGRYAWQVRHISPFVSGVLERYVYDVCRYYISPSPNELPVGIKNTDAIFRIKHNLMYGQCHGRWKGLIEAQHEARH